MKRALVAGVGMAMASLLVPTAARADDVCTYDENTHTVTAVSADGDGSLVIMREGEEITVFDADCGEATVSNTDKVVVDGSSTDVQVNLFLNDGQFRPGFTDEEGNSDEIEFEFDFTADDALMVLGGGTPLAIRIGAGSAEDPQTRLNLNFDEFVTEDTPGVDADVVIDRVSDVIVVGASEEGSGHTFMATGGRGTGEPYPIGLELFGGSGDDTIVGGLGSDLLRGGLGPDRLSGWRGEDKLSGANGDDFMKGGRGSDRIRGNIGYDVIEGEKGPDFLIGSKDQDVLRGGPGGDKVQGGQENDRLRGGTGKDSLFGEDGEDSLDGDEGSDFCDGGFGNDQYKSCETQP